MVWYFKRIWLILRNRNDTSIVQHYWKLCASCIIFYTAFRILIILSLNESAHEFRWRVIYQYTVYSICTDRQMICLWVQNLVFVEYTQAVKVLRNLSFLFFVFQFHNIFEAKSVLVQVAFSLAVAEESLQFEHRDLHWGNVLVQKTKKTHLKYKLMGQLYKLECHNIHVSIIDFTLSRLHTGIKSCYMHVVYRERTLKIV